jgi:tyrosine-protein kinase Etk/Wzc
MMDAAKPAAEPTHATPAGPAWPPPSIGWLEVALPLWARRWRLLVSGLLAALIGLALGLSQVVRFTGEASFVVTPTQRPSQAGLSAMSGVPGALPGSLSPLDLHVAVLKSRTVADRLIERFDLARGWGVADASQARALLARRMSFTVARREGIVYVEVEDVHPQRAAALANQAVEELRLILRGFALTEARQRRTFYEAQLARARGALDAAQKRLQASGYDRAALRSEPGAAASAYGRQQAEIAAAEVRLAALRLARADSSPEVQRAQAEIGAQRAQLARMEVPRDDAPGAFTARLREFRYAEALADQLARQVEAARFDEDAEPLPLQWLDQAQPPRWPSKPRLPNWVVLGFLLGLFLQGGWVLMRHRARLAQQDPSYRLRLAQVQAELPARRPGWLARLRARRAALAGTP